MTASAPVMTLGLVLLPVAANWEDSEVVENNELYGKTEDYNQYDKDTKVVDDNQYYDD